MKRVSQHPSRRRASGQSVTEFALLLPVLLTLVGASIDLARVYFTWIQLEAATRDAAQWLASDPARTTTGGYYDSTDAANYCNNSFPCSSAPGNHAKSVLDAQVGASFTVASNQASCDGPQVWGEISGTPATSSSAGGSPAYPVATGVVRACLPFRTLFPYPFITHDGAYVLRSERTVTTIVGR